MQLWLSNIIVKCFTILKSSIRMEKPLPHFPALVDAFPRKKTNKSIDEMKVFQSLFIFLDK